MRVLDFSRILAGPYCTMVLSDLGADVIKVERPGKGDDTRSWGPPFAGGESGYFLSVNRGKRSLALDLAHPDGRATALALAERADVVIENFRPGGAAKLGLGYDALAARNPGLVMTSISGFGQTGPYRDRAGYDALIQAMGGLISITGEPGRPPVKVGVALVDVLAGLFAATATLAALRERDRSGLGQRIDISLFDSLVAALVNQAQTTLMTGEPPAPLGHAHPSIVPYQLFDAADGPLFVAAGNDGQFAALASVLDSPALPADARFRTNADRVTNRDALVSLLSERFATRPRGEWLERLEAAGVPAGPLNDLAQVMNDPQIAARRMVRSVSHPSAGELRQVASPITMSRTEMRELSAPPRLGEGGLDALREWLELDEDALSRLTETGAVLPGPEATSD